MNPLAHWLGSSLVYGTLFFAVAWVLSKTLLRNAHPGARALLFGLVLLKFVVPFGPPLPRVLAPALTSAPVSTLTVAVLPKADTSTSSVPWQSLLLAVWALGVCGVTARRVIKHRRLVRSLGAAQSAPARVVELATKLGVAVPRVVFDARGPCLVGVVNPVLVLPPEATGATLDAMVVHELTHLRRRDPLWLSLQALVETLFFFWPVVRIASRQLSLAREQACDLSVVETGVISRASYAEVLLELGLESSASLAMAAEPSHLERRIKMVLSATKLRPMWAVVVIIGAAGLALASASVSVDPDPASVSASPDARLSVGRPATERLRLHGSIDERVLEMQMITHRYELDRCYEDYLRAHPGVGAGSVVLHFTIKTDGTADEGCQSEGTTLPMDIGRCITDRITSWQFPMPYDLQDVTLEYRFDFTPPVTQT